MVTQERLKELFEYRDGRLIRRETGEPAEVRHSRGYLQISFDNECYLAHRMVFLYHHGYLPHLTDHRNRDKTDNRIENLRESTYSKNGINVSKVRSNTGRKGVTYCKRDKLYRVSICKDRTHHRVGWFKTLEEAAQAYEKAREELFPGVFEANE